MTIKIVNFKDSEDNIIRQGNIGLNNIEDYVNTLIDDIVVASVELVDIPENRTEIEILQEQIDALTNRITTLEGRS